MQKKQVFREGFQIRDYKIVKYISSGAYGQIYQAFDIKNPDRKLALKALYQSQFNQHRKLQELYNNEVNLLKKLKGHPNICEYMDNFEDMKFKYLVMEFCNGGDLIQLLKKKRIFQEEEALKYLSQILEAFKALHNQDKHIIHRDIKLENIFLHDGCCKLGDFGFAREVPKGKELAQTWCGSLLTMAPEVIDGKQGYGIQADIYSLGAILYQMIFGDFPYKCYNDNEAQLLRDIKNCKMNLSLNGIQVSEDIKSLLKQMMTFDPNERITFEQLYNHKFFTSEKREYFTGNKEINQQVVVNDSQALSSIKEEQEKDIHINIKLIGAINVGKTSICSQYVNGYMPENSTTVGIDKFKKQLQIKEDSVILNIFDTAGLEKHSNLPSNYYKQTDAYILVIDLSDETSVETIDYWIEEIEKFDQNDFEDGVKGSNNIIVAANKSDVPVNIRKNQEYLEKKQELMDKRIQVIECSAKTQDNLQLLFQTVQNKILPAKKNFSAVAAASPDKNQNDKYNNPSIKPSQLKNGASNVKRKQEKEKKKGGCC